MMRKILTMLGLLPAFMLAGLACIVGLSCAKQEKSGKDKELLAKLEGFDYVTIVFEGQYMGFDVCAEIHPDEANKEVGLARYFFKNTVGELVIDTPYYWDWEKEATVRPSHYNLESRALFSVPHRDRAVQNGEEEIEFVLPFCFKDVDFDGVREILISTSGNNKIFFNTFKIINDTEASYMSKMPRFAYGLDSTGTTFDYGRKRIRILEQTGFGEVRYEEYKRKYIVLNPLNPLKRVSSKKEAGFPEGQSGCSFK